MKIQEDKIMLNQKKESKYFCTAPWVHLHTWPDGKVFPCCNSNIDKNFGNLHDTPVKDIWNSEQVIKFRKDLLEDTPRPDFCSRCYEMEESGGGSLRTHFNRNFYNQFEEQNQEEVPLRLYYWDFRFSNICNQSCRTCGYYLSSAWYDDFFSQHGMFPPDLTKKFTHFTKDDVNKTIIKEHIKYVREINFAGGEPTIMDEHKFVLEQLLENNRTDIIILLTTNLASLTFKDMNFLEVWPKFREMNICVSLDEIGDRAEYWRNGTNWDKFVKNIKQVKELTLKHSNVKLMFGITTSIFNTHRLSTMIQYLIDEKIVDRNVELRYNPLIEPKYFDAKNMPDAYKELAIQDLEKLKTMPYQQRNLIDAIIYKIKRESEPEMIRMAARQIAEIDKVRGQRLEVVAPELYNIYKEYGYNEYYATFKKFEKDI